MTLAERIKSDPYLTASNCTDLSDCDAALNTIKELESLYGPSKLLDQRRGQLLLRKDKLIKKESVKMTTEETIQKFRDAARTYLLSCGPDTETPTLCRIVNQSEENMNKVIDEIVKRTIQNGYEPLRAIMQLEYEWNPNLIQ